MEISVASQLWAIVYSLAVGVFLGLSYDVVRITRVLAGLRPCAPTRLSSVNLPIIGRRAGEIKKRNRFFADVFVFCGDIILRQRTLVYSRRMLCRLCLIHSDRRTCGNARVRHGELRIIGGIRVFCVFSAVSVQNDLFTDHSAAFRKSEAPKKLNADGPHSKRTCQGT